MFVDCKREVPISMFVFLYSVKLPRLGARGLQNNNLKKTRLASNCCDIAKTLYTCRGGQSEHFSRGHILPLALRLGGRGPNVYMKNIYFPRAP